MDEQEENGPGPQKDVDSGGPPLDEEEEEERRRRRRSMPQVKSKDPNQTWWGKRENHVNYRVLQGPSNPGKPEKHHVLLGFFKFWGSCGKGTWGKRVLGSRDLGIWAILKRREYQVSSPRAVVVASKVVRKTKTK